MRGVAAAPGDTVAEGAPLLFVEPAEVDAAHVAEDAEPDPGEIRADLAFASAPPPGETGPRHRWIDTW